MDFIVSQADRDTRHRTGSCNMATCAGYIRAYRSGMIDIAVIDEICTMADKASPCADRCTASWSNNTDFQ